MKYTSLKKQKLTKNILSIFFSLIMGVALSFGLFTSKTMAANENFTIDFIIATTDLRNASKYTNDTTLTEYVQDDNGNFIKWALNGEYYNIKTQLTKGERTIKSAISPKVDENNDGNGDIVYFAPLNAYYNADGTGITNLTNSFSNTNFDGTNVINSFVDGLELELGADVNYLYFRFNEAGELKPYGNIAKVIQLSDGTILADSERLVSTELTYTQNTFEVYLLNINETNQSYVEIDNKTNPLYAFTYLYGYDYTEFSNEKYGEIAGANDTIIFASLDSEKQLKSDSTTYNRYLMYPTLSEGEYVLFNGAWQEISYCNADGSQDAGFEGETNYALLYNQDGIKIWVELGTNIYYYSQDNMLEKLTLKTADNIEIKTYAYKLNRDLYIKSSNASGGFDYKTINETLGDSLKITGIGTEAFSISGIPYKYDERVCKSNYYYDIFKAVYDSNNKDIIGYQYYNQELRAQDNFKAGGESAFINTYFSDDILENLYYFGESGYTPVFKQVYDNNSKTGELSSTTSSSSKIILNNYSTQETLYNNTNTSINAQVENVYLSFGDIFDPIKNNSMTEITYGITVELKLYNTYYNGITIVTNEPVRQTEKNVSKDDTQVLKNNEFWFQYLDLRNLRYYTDQNRSANDVVEESAGKYVLNISYTTYNRDTKVDKSNLSFRYTFYVDELSNKLDYPTFNTETAFALNEIDAINYYYNFQNDVIPTITFDASEYGLNYTYNYGQYSLEYQSEFFTVSRPSRNDNTKRTYTVTDNSITGVNTTIDQNIRTVVETSVLDITQYTSTSTSPYQRHKIVANATIIDKPEIENSNISYIDGNNVTRNYDRLILLEYYYYLNDTNLNFGNIDYKNEPYGRFYKKIVQIIGFDKNSECYSYFTYTTEEETAEKTSWVSYEISKDYSGQIIYTTKIAPVNNFSLTSYYENLSGFKADKYQQLFTNEIIDFDYIITISFEELGQYYFELKYVTSTEPVSSNTTLGPAYNSPDYYSFKYPYIENTYINNSMPTIEPVLQDTKKKILNVLLDTNQHENVVFGEYKLDIFGVKSYFNEYDSKTNTSTTIDFRQVEEDIYSDVTSKVVGKEITYSDITAGCTLNGNTSIAKIPNTNRVPIKFDYYCNYIYDGSIPESKIYRYTSFTYNDDETCTINNLNKMEVSYFDKDTKPHLDGYYEVIIKYFYKDNDNELKEQYQVFAFVIDNSAPNVTYSTLKESIIDNDSKYSYWESMEHNTYTNSPVRATWRTANYFQYEVNPRLYKTNYSGITSLYGS